MNPAYAIYILEMEWTWDHANHEFTTITIEGCEGARAEQDFEEQIKTEGGKRVLVNRLRKIADTVAYQPMGKSKLICLYRVVDDSSQNLELGFHQRNGLKIELRLVLEPICRFDRNDNVISVKSELVPGGL